MMEIKIETFSIGPWNRKSWDLEILPVITFSKAHKDEYNLEKTSYILMFSWMFWSIGIAIQ